MAAPGASLSPADAALLDAFARACAAGGLAASATPRTALTLLYAKVPRLPPLYESLALGYRWPDLDLPGLRLLGNPPGRTLGGLAGGMERHAGKGRLLIRAGLVPVGLSPAPGTDPVCLATARRRQGGDCPVVQISKDDLARGRMRSARELAPSFRQLIEDVVARRPRPADQPAVTSARRVASSMPAAAPPAPARARRWTRGL